MQPSELDLILDLVRGVPQQVALPIAAEALAGAVALVGAAAGVLVLLVQVAASTLASAAAVPAQEELHLSKYSPKQLQCLVLQCSCSMLPPPPAIAGPAMPKSTS